MHITVRSSILCFGKMMDLIATDYCLLLFYMSDWVLLIKGTQRKLLHYNYVALWGEKINTWKNI